jgi:putative transposase
MPRTARAIVANYCYHVINRGNRKATVFHEPADYRQFLGLMAQAQRRSPVPMLAACLMPNHIHLVMRPPDGESLSEWVHWVFTTHVRWYHAKHGSTGRVWQGRFKAFPIQQDHHLLTVMRYVERNALRAQLVERAEDWPWGSLQWRREARPALSLAESPVPLPTYWRHLVNEPQSAVELAELRVCVNRQRPFGDATWVARQAADLGLDQSLRPVGRPRRRALSPFPSK